MPRIGFVLLLALLGQYPKFPLPADAAAFPPVPPSPSYQVVFEDVGQVAPSVTYLHLAVELQIPKIVKAVQEYGNITQVALQNPQPHLLESVKLHVHPSFRERLMAVWIPLFGNFSKEFKTMESKFLIRHAKLAARVQHLMDILPHSAPSTVHDYAVDDMRVRRSIRQKRGLPLLLIRGVVGTLMGLYSRRKTRKLRDDLDTVIRRQRRILLVQATQSVNMIGMEKAYKFLPTVVEKTSLMAPMRVLLDLLEIEQVLDDEIRKVSAAVQQAQLRRLSIFVLNGTRLNDAFTSIKRRADELKLELLIERPSDLFQIEVSYFFDGTDVSLLLHVPMAAPKSMMRLQRFLPFPLSFTDQHFLLPSPDKNLFAISSGDVRLSMELDEADLEGCYRLNSMHLCERLGVVSLGIESSCLGALYSQNFDRASKLCRMDVVTPSERVLRLGGNRYLVYATTPFTAHIACRNATSNEHHFSVGINRIQLSPSCSVTLQEHVIFVDSALQMDNQVREIIWDPAALKMDPEAMEEVQESIGAATEDGVANPTLKELRRSSGSRRRRVGWTIFFLLTGFVIIVALGTWAFCFLSTHKWWMLKKSVEIIHRQVTDAISSRLHLPRLTRSAPATPLPKVKFPRILPRTTSLFASAPPGGIDSGNASDPSDYAAAAAEPAEDADPPRRRRRRRVASFLLHRGSGPGARELARLLRRPVVLPLQPLR